MRVHRFGALEPYAPLCEVCGKAIERPSFQGHIRKACSPECHRERRRRQSAASRAKRRAENPNYLAEQAAAQKAWRQANPDAAATIARRRHLMGTYKITPEQYDALLLAQNGLCAICGTSEGDASGRGLHVDHDHTCCPGDRSCGQCIRGLICKGCNTGMGCMNDDPARLEAAAAYIRRHAAS